MTKKFLVAAVLFVAINGAKAQDSSGAAPIQKKIIDLSNRANDHLLIQFGVDGWSTSGLASNLKPSGFSRHFNIYFLFDKPFKSNPHMSVAYGIGMGWSNIFFKDVYLDLKSTQSTLPITDVSTSASNHYKKFKLVTSYLEVPLELRWVANAENPNRGLKFAVGAKFGLLMKAWTKGKNALDATGKSIYGGSYIIKEQSKQFFNSTKVAGTVRIGLGHFSLDGSYQLTGLLKDGAGPTIRPYSIGLTLSGL
ncbi:outer membrane beta-barrel protein [Foetidibacter luteolus]|uniref:outer membrane beta-barrel protein n=1 Tax=Foetidibacter luteolus TaxID=2608880 RepID=UPI00129B8AFA|nr:outer membrane beta-barrel protein [Foetidibacter luteolus]